MSHLNVEIKARCFDLETIRCYLNAHGAILQTAVRQIDTYFQCKEGKFKLRQDQLRTRLIHYAREITAGPKKSWVTFYEPQDVNALREILSRALGIKVVVKKHREIYLIENVKFHLDQVENLGTFIEIEAIDYDGTIGADKLYCQCEHYLDALGIQADQLIEGSYADLLLNPAS